MARLKAKVNYWTRFTETFSQREYFTLICQDCQGEYHWSHVETPPTTEKIMPRSYRGNP